MPPGSATPLPEFEHPPVSEVALSVQFEALNSWRAVHAGLYWSQIKAGYPITETQAPLQSQIEQYDGYIPVESQVTTSVPDIDLGRFWFISADQTRLIQGQRDRYIIN